MSLPAGVMEPLHWVQENVVQLLYNTNEKRFATYNGSAPEVRNMKAMEKIILAYKTFKVTDMFGDIPFSEAGYGFQDLTLTHPKFDSQQSIYFTCLDYLKWAADSIDVNATTKEPFLSFKKFDNLFYGDMKKWRKLANSLRLRYAIRMYNSAKTESDSIVKAIIDGNLPCFGINDFGMLVDDPYNESACIWPFQLGYRNESKGWSFNQSKDVRMGTNMWRFLSENDSTSGSGIYDPRAYYFFDTNNDNKWKPFPNYPPTATPDGGIPYEYQRDVAYSVKGADCLFSPMNYYLVRDMDYQPDILINGAEVLYLRAEAYMRGIGVAPDEGLAGTAFLDGLQFSLSFWKNVMNNSRLPLGAGFAANVNVPQNLDFISVQNHLVFFTGNSTDKLQEIYTYQWIDFLRQPQEAWSLARRTFNAGTPTTPRQGNQLLQVYRLPIPPTEVAYNTANWTTTFGSTGDNLNQKIWWMK